MLRWFILMELIRRAVVYINNTRIAHSPLRELNEASKRTQTMVKVLDTAKQLQQIRSGSSEFYSYMTTLTIPNCNKDELDQLLVVCLLVLLLLSGFTRWLS